MTHATSQHGTATKMGITIMLVIMMILSLLQRLISN